MFCPALKIIPTLAKAEKEVLGWLLAGMDLFQSGVQFSGLNSMEEDTGYKWAGPSVRPSTSFLESLEEGPALRLFWLPAQQVLCPGSEGWDRVPVVLPW